VVKSVVRNWEANFVIEAKKATEEDTYLRMLATFVETAEETDFQSYDRCRKIWPHKPIEAPHDPTLEETGPYTKVQRRLKNNNHSPRGFLRPAKEILKCIRGDRTNFKIDEWIVGYEDRHMLAIQEKPVREWRLDSSHESWIPEHRIEYFKHVSEDGQEAVKWEKASKLDLVSKQPQRQAIRQSENEEPVFTRRQRKQKAQEERENKRAQRSSDLESDKQILQAGEGKTDEKMNLEKKERARLKGTTKRQPSNQQRPEAPVQSAQEQKQQADRLKLKKQSNKCKKRAATNQMKKR
jgi:hypothetical protein